MSLTLYQGRQLPPAYAILSNISERGACVHSDRILPTGHLVRLSIQFQREQRLFDTTGRIAWTRAMLNGEGIIHDGAVSGIEFSLPSDTSEQQLRKVLLSGHFGNADPFENMLRGLRPELEQLGEHLREILRRHRGESE